MELSCTATNYMPTGCARYSSRSQREWAGSGGACDEEPASWYQIWDQIRESHNLETPGLGLTSQSSAMTGQCARWNALPDYASCAAARRECQSLSRQPRGPRAHAHILRCSLTAADLVSPSEIIILMR